MPVTNNERCTGRGNPTDNTSARWPASTAIAGGSLVYQDSAGLDQPASAFTFLADLAATQRAFKAVFRGVGQATRIAAQTVAGTEITDDGIYVAGEFTMTCAALGSAVKPGAFVGPAANGGNTALLPSTVIVCTPDCAIGVVTEHAAAGLTELTFQLLPTLTTGGGVAAGGGLGSAGYFTQAAPVAKTTTTTLTAAELLSGFLTASQGAAGAATYTLPTGTLLDAAVSPNLPVNGAFTWTITNISTNAAEIVTVAAGTDHTVVGNMTIAANGATTSQTTGTFLTRKTAANTYVTYRIAG